MTETTFVTFCHDYADALAKTQLREGQLAFNMLTGVRPDLATIIRSSPLDPFYLDEHLPLFWAFLKSRWDTS